jgi:hydroxymethylbilane synthase
MSSEHFFGKNKFAVVDRDDTRDVAIFNNYIEEKIKRGEPLIIGTCSPRREQMAIYFLKKALPQLKDEIRIETRSIRGNVETRLRKLDNGEYDATILAAAGLNRLLGSEKDADIIKSLLADKKRMLLPLIECVPAPCQGAIVAEAHHTNRKAIEILKRINDGELFADCCREKEEAIRYGAGCIQKFGVTTINTKNGKYLYAAGKDAEGTEFVKWDRLAEIKIDGLLFSTTDLMKVFFDYQWSKEKINTERPVVFVANYKAIPKSSIDPIDIGLLSQGPSDFSRSGPASQQPVGSSNQLTSKTILASGTKAWFELARKGYWVTACADGLGFEFLLSSLRSPLLNIKAEQITILTHDAAAKRWKAKGFNAISDHKLVAKDDEAIQKSIANADAIFWTSFSQYEFYGKYARPHVKHLCAGGETAELLKHSGVTPVIFPTIKAFEQWRKYFIQSRSVA